DLQGGLYVASIKGSSAPRLLVDKFVAGYPAWNADESEIAVAKASIAAGSVMTYSILAIKIGDSSNRLVDQIKLDGPCGSPALITDPARALYEREIGQSYPSLAWLNSGSMAFAPPTGCKAAGGGTAIVIPGLSFPQASPDQTEFLGVDASI